MNSWQLGSDPEFMVIDANGSLRSAIPIVKVPKKRAIKQNGCSYYYDNVLAECTLQPGSSKEQAVENIRTAIRGFSEILGGKGFKLHVQASANYPQKELEHKAARVAGCKPETCAYIIDDIPPTKARKKIEKGSLRSAGGHIHLGTHLGKQQSSCLMLVRMLDLFVAIPSLYLDNDPTTANRKKLYGVAGRYRRPEHGVEYRSLGNFWLSSPKLVEVIYDLCDFTIKFVEEDGHSKFWWVDEEKINAKNFWNVDGDPAKYHFCNGYDINKLRECYDKTNKEIAKEFMDLASNYLPKKLIKRIFDLSEIKQYDLYKEWGI